MRFPRASGILLHPTSLPGPHGLGDLGPEAYRFVDFLASAGQSLWQMLPLGPVGYGASPYAAYSAFAGSPLMISLELFVKNGWLTADELVPASPLPADKADYTAAGTFRMGLLLKAFERFSQNATNEQRQAIWEYTRTLHIASWLEDYVLFMSIKDDQGDKPWSEWPDELRLRQPNVIHETRQRLSDRLWFHRFLQWQFDVQWDALRRYAHTKGVEIVGDMPIYVSEDSADVWSHPELFWLDGRGQRLVVAGVPPDYFSETGQLWGNPLYRWDRAEATQYAWWIERFRVLFARVDRVRVDHFRGFEAYWEVPAGEKTAIRGRWVPGPGPKLFRAIQRSLGDLAIIAEDLGIITPEVEQLRDAFQFPGMKILQFAFAGDNKNAYLPHNYQSNCVVYTGTHDNDTTRGWLDAAPEKELQHVLDYVDTNKDKAVWDLIRLAQASVADVCVIPMQDLLELGTEARMNVPGTVENNWLWRAQDGVFSTTLARRLKDMARLYRRLPAR